MSNENKPLLIINGFDRVSAAATIETDEYLGFADFWDQGVPDKYDLNYIGAQYDFSEKSPWIDDDAPGHGASYGDFESKVIPGNTFDFPYLHGKSIMKAGYSFVSASDEAIIDRDVDIAHYKYVDLILGEEKTTDGPKPILKKRFKAFPKSFQKEIRRYCSNGGNLFITGAYVGTDLFGDNSDSLDTDFAENILNFRFRTNHAVKTGGVFSVNQAFLPLTQAFNFNTGYHPKLYAVEAPDAIEPANSSAKTILRYTENNTSAAVAYQGKTNIVIFGFPFETIISEESRNNVMQSVLSFFDRN